MGAKQKSHSGSQELAAVLGIEEETRRELSARVLGSLTRYVRERHGQRAVEEIAEAASLAPSALGGNGWISVAQFEAVLAKAWEFMADEEEFVRACAYKLQGTYGPARFLLRAASVRAVMDFAARTMKYVSKVSRVDVLESDSRMLHGKYYSSVPESRLMCLSRTSQMAMMPAIWGLPKAEIEEHSCIAHGDECCEYILRWQDHLHTLRVASGAALALTVALPLYLATIIPVFVLIGMVCVGLLGGYTLELARHYRTTLLDGEDANQNLRELAERYREANDEILDHHRREQEWSARLDRQVNERTARLSKVVTELESVRKGADRGVRYTTHDLAGPVRVLQRATARMGTMLDPTDPDQKDLANDVDHALGDISRLLDGLDKMAGGSNSEIALKTEQVNVEGLAKRLRRRLKALLVSGEVRGGVITSREAPSEIETDPLMLDRVIDNLLTNAAKYTEKGSIVVEVSGTPGFLVIKVSDTGVGISRDRIERVFSVGENTQSGHFLQSYGLGLPIVVRMLDRVGGRLEVLSRPGVGTTFWAYVPTKPTELQGQNDPSSALERVVKIRVVSADQRVVANDGGSARASGAP